MATADPGSRVRDETEKKARCDNSGPKVRERGYVAFHDMAHARTKAIHTEIPAVWRTRLPRRRAISSPSATFAQTVSVS